MCKVKYQHLELERTLALLPLSVALAEGEGSKIAVYVRVQGYNGAWPFAANCVTPAPKQILFFSGRGGYFTFIIALAKWPRVWPNPASEHRAAVRSSTPGSLCAAGPKQKISLLAPLACSPGGLHEISSDELLLADLSGAEGARVLGVLHAVDHCWF